MKNNFYFAFLCLFFLSNILYSQIYLDSTKTVEERVVDLLSRMTIDEKIGQLVQADHKAVTNMQDMLTYHIGSILSGGGSDPASGNTALDWANLYDSFQQKALESRLKIPIIYGIDAVHGNSNVEGAVIFPHNIGLGATGNAELVQDISRITAIEMAATGMDWAFAPCVAVPQDERWGRTYEGFGETPDIVSPLGDASVRGLQGEILNNLTSVAACAKHYLGDGGTTGGDDQGNTEVTEEELRAIHLPGYITAIENDVKTVMVSYSSWNGQKMHGHNYMINDVLKGELGFKGFVVSDWAGIDQLPGDYRSDIKTSINAGIDMVMVPNNYTEFYNSLNSLVTSSEISNARIDDAVRRILAVKFELGLFEHPYAQRSLLPLVGSEEHRAVARKAVRESMVLLKKSDNILPLPKSGSKILVVGEHADNIGLQCGGWTIQWQGQSGDITEGTTILEGLRKIAPGAEIIYSPDGSYTGDDIDYIIAVIGEHPYAEGDGDRENLNLENSDIEKINELKSKGAPVITILISGRPMIINPVLHNSDVFFVAWLPGTEGDGIAEILFGDAIPSGLLPLTWPASMEQIPINVGDDDYNPLFPYQYGITSFTNSVPGTSPKLQSAMILPDGKHIELSFDKSMNNPANSTASFIVTTNGSQNISVISFTVNPLDENRIILETSESFQRGDIVTLSYTSGNIKAEDGGILDSFQNIDVINFLDNVSLAFSLPGKIEAEDYSNMFGIDTETTSDIGGGFNVGWIDTGDWLEYRCDAQYNGTYSIRFRIASESSGGKLQFIIDGENLFEQNIPVTGGWQNWQTVSSISDLEKGEFTLRLYASAGGFNLNWFEITVITDMKEITENKYNYLLNQNYPNPFNPETVITYNLESAGHVSLTVRDVLGREVAMLVNSFQVAGNHSVRFDGSQFTSGIYFYTLSTLDKSDDYFTSTKKMILLK